MSLSYNSAFFKIYCKFFAKFVGEDDYGNSYYTKKNNSINGKVWIKLWYIFLKLLLVINYLFTFMYFNWLKSTKNSTNKFVFFLKIFPTGIASDIMPSTPDV